jgi:exodeoxyribonuclease V alpha subunit
MTITGVVQSIIYSNESNGYTIASFYPEIDNLEEEHTIEQIHFLQEGEITIVGYLPFIHEGDNLSVTGKIVRHPDYGEQLKVETFEKIMPKTLDALEMYLADGFIKGIGPATAKKIIKKFGEDTIQVLKTEPKKLATIKGITQSKAEEISQSFIENWELWQIVGFLQKFGISSSNAQGIYKKLGLDAIEKINQDPYILEDLGIRVDFNQIDKMAMSIGIERNSLKRIGSGILHSLRLATYNGHTCVLKGNLITYVTELLGLSEEDIEDGLKDLSSKEKIFIEKREDDSTWVYLIEYFKAEIGIVERIMSLQKADNLKKIFDLKTVLKTISKKEDIELSPKQKQAIKLVNDNNVSIITGGPGTGKTTIIKTIIDMYDSFNKSTVLCAPTGRAAKRMTEATGKEAKTLHRLLEIRKILEDGLDPDMDVAPISADVIIIDEMSMVDIFLMNLFLKGIFKGSKVVFVGDSDQLPSVGPGNVLKDLISSESVPYIVLNKIFRQAAQSEIIVNSHKVNEGINFIGDISNEGDTKDDCHFIAENNPDQAISRIIFQYDDYTQVITPTKKGKLGTKNLNKVLQEKFNPFEVDVDEKKFGDVIFRVGDKVMQTKNNYDIQWQKDDEIGQGIFNGEMGIITEIDDIDGRIWIRFDDGKVAGIEYQDMDQIEHAFAITVHKSQGSEFSKVIMPILDVSPILLTRNILYTGMTRAKDDLTIIGNSETIEYMINNVNTKKRNSGLEYKLKNY